MKVKNKKESLRNHVDNLIRYEQGDLSGDEIVEMFQGLIDTGLVWHLQGHYGRTAKVLIKTGYCSAQKQ